MKKTLSWLFAIMCVWSIPCFALKDKKDATKSVIPESYLEVINKSDSVTFIVIDPWSEATEDWMDGYGEILNTKTYKDKKLQSACYDVLANPNSFKISNLVKNCTFMPDIAIVFHGKKENVTVAYSFYCDVCRFAKGEKYDDFDGELIRKDFINLASKGLPKDRYVRYLVKKSKSNFE